MPALWPAIWQWYSLNAIYGILASVPGIIWRLSDRPLSAVADYIPELKDTPEFDRKVFVDKINQDLVDFFLPYNHKNHKTRNADKWMNWWPP